jgi:uncharacterized protein (DUF1778 family)
MNDKYEMKRNEYFKFRVSKEEKELIKKYAESLGINASRVVRNIVMQQAESILNKPFYIPISKTYIKWCELTNNQEVLKRIKTP